MIIFQIIPISLLIAYMLYLIYYHTLPMCRFKLMLFRAIRRKICIGLISGDGKLTVRYMKNGREERYTRAIDEDCPDRFLTLAACRTLKSILSDIENGVI